MACNRTLTPEILAEHGWDKVEETPYHISYTKDLDEQFGHTDFCAYMSVKFRSFPESDQYHVQFDIERTVGDGIRTNFKRQITVREFNTLLAIADLKKFKIK